MSKLLIEPVVSAADFEVEPLVTARDIGERLAVDEATVRQWARAGKVPSYKIPGGVRFLASEIEVIKRNGGKR